MNIAEMIFSLKSHTETHYIMRIFGIKIKFPKVKSYLKKVKNPYYKYKKNKLDISTLPPASGQLRDIQLANFALLKELDYVCKQNGLKYWLDFGTVLGAVRHKGFIPWDDDVDTGMMRDDYEKLIDAFKKSSRNPDIYADYKRTNKVNCTCFIKIQHRKCPHLFADVFPYDELGSILSPKERIEKTKEIKRLVKHMHRNHNCEDLSDVTVLGIINDTRDKILSKTNQEKSDIVWGADFKHSWSQWIYAYDTFFPLSEISFEGLNFPCANKKERFLTDVYGDYTAYPKKITFGHAMYSELDEEEKRIIGELGKGL